MDWGFVGLSAAYFAGSAAVLYGLNHVMIKCQERRAAQSVATEGAVEESDVATGAAEGSADEPPDDLIEDPDWQRGLTPEAELVVPEETGQSQVTGHKTPPKRGRPAAAESEVKKRKTGSRVHAASTVKGKPSKKAPTKRRQESSDSSGSSESSQMTVGSSASEAMKPQPQASKRGGRK